MAFVYRYVSLYKGDVFYVGKTHSADLSGVYARVSAHKSDEKFKKQLPPTARVEYIELKSPADADIAETAFISIFNPPLNSSKTGWGQTSFSFDTLGDWLPLEEKDRRKTGFHRSFESYGPEWPDEVRDKEKEIIGFFCNHCGREFHVDAEYPSIFWGQWSRVKPPLYLSWRGGIFCEQCARALEKLLDEYANSKISVRTGKGGGDNGEEV